MVAVLAFTCRSGTLAAAQRRSLSGAGNIPTYIVVTLTGHCEPGARREEIFRVEEEAEEGWRIACGEFRV